jgi:hypothetical protein
VDRKRRKILLIFIPVSAAGHMPRGIFALLVISDFLEDIYVLCFCLGGEECFKFQQKTRSSRPHRVGADSI